MKTFSTPGVLGWAAALAAGLVLFGCGGNDDDNPPPAATSQVPAGASQSIAGFISYLQELVVASADTLEPVDTGLVTGPTDETSEPVKVD